MSKELYASSSIVPIEFNFKKYSFDSIKLFIDLLHGLSPSNISLETLLQFIEYIIDDGKAEAEVDESTGSGSSFEYRLLEAACTSLSKGKIKEDIIPKVRVWRF